MVQTNNEFFIFHFVVTGIWEQWHKCCKINDVHLAQTQALVHSWTLNTKYGIGGVAVFSKTCIGHRITTVTVNSDRICAIQIYGDNNQKRFHESCKTLCRSRLLLYKWHATCFLVCPCITDLPVYCWPIITITCN